MPPLYAHDVLHLQPAWVDARWGAGSAVVDVVAGVVVVVVVVVVAGVVVVVVEVEVEVVGASVVGAAVVETTRGQ